MPTVQLLIKGKVQGVFYRATARQIAKKIGITGWIKNNREGRVEATVSGTEDQLQKFISWCKKGPESAVVNEVVVFEKEETLFDEFVVIR
ncbi:MAG: acylphosphatase [Chitinophagaceae bacterium]|jgi:acylphosphatase|nr:acylphosphatase [Chitinophagaceae bacterium]